MTDTSERASEFVRDLGDAALKNPVSAALIGMGALWLLVGRNGGSVPGVARDAWQRTRTGLREGADRLQDSVQNVAGTVREGVRASDRVSDIGNTIARSVTDYAGDFPDVAANAFDDMRANLTDVFQAQPLALGVVGLAIGAAVAASLPTTETEASYMGKTSDYVKQQASEMAGQQAERAADIGKKVAEAVVDEARQLGLTADGVKAATKDLSDKVARIADAAMKSNASEPNNRSLT